MKSERKNIFNLGAGEPDYDTFIIEQDNQYSCAVGIVLFLRENLFQSRVNINS